MEQQAPEEAGTAAQPSLAGVRVLLTRRPDRSTALSRTLQEAGASTRFLPLIDFERAADAAALPQAVREMARGRYDWLVITSATTVDALAGAAAQAGTTLAAAVPDGTRVAVVGAGTAAALKQAGVDAALVPAQQSAAGLLAEWPAGPGAQGHAAVLLPQADIASGTLRDGLQAKGLDVHCIGAYCTVPYPADPMLALYPAVFPSEGLLTPEVARAELATGRIDAMVAASPSQVRRLAELQIPLDSCSLVVIGPATDAEARERGLPVAATAANPHPRSVAAAVERAVHGAEPGQ